jgi:hypothetical protein
MSTQTNSTNSSAPSGKVRRYLRLILRAGDRLLYKRDYAVESMFEIFIRKLVSDLTRGGIVDEGDSYYAVIIPGYEHEMLATPLLLSTEHKLNKAHPWISLEFDDHAHPDEPLTYYTVEIHIMEKSVVYRRNFEVSKLIPFFRRIEPALVHIGALRDGDSYQPQIFAREDDQAELDREEFSELKKEAGSLVEIVSDADELVEFPEKSLSDYQVEETIGDAPAEDSLKVVITRSALTATQEIARRRAGVEEGGVLIGNVFKNGSSSNYLVEISGHIFAEEARGSQFELRYTFESWQKWKTQLTESYPDCRIVGWYHTHLIKMKHFNEETQQTESTEHFFSLSDLFMHRQFFPDKWYVAMVLNPLGEAVCFQWRGSDIVRSRGFYVVKG